jgi:hypothetical protein
MSEQLQDMDADAAEKHADDEAWAAHFEDQAMNGGTWNFLNPKSEIIEDSPDENEGDTTQICGVHGCSSAEECED